MSFPIPSFFKIRCGIIIIVFLLFFMFVGLLKQAYSFGFTCGCITYDWSHNVNRVSVCKVFVTETARDAALSADRGDWSYHCDGSGSTSSGNFKACSDFAANGEFNVGVYAYCPNTCPDSNGNGKPDACETCPSQTGYKTNLLIASYCGNKVTQCNGESHTDYEWGFGPDSCTPAQEPDCHVTADCKKDSNQDGIADGQEGDGTYSGNPKADLDGDSIPDLKDCDFDFDNDGKKNCEDPCPTKSNPGTAVCPDPCAGGTEQCQDADGDGIPDCTCPYGGECWQCADGDGDGVPNGVDNDIDGDNIANAQDNDIDGDGKLNADDDDIDGDGIPNSQDTDKDGDGKPDDEDSCPSGKDTTACDSDGDGTPDDQQEATTTPYAPKVDPYSVEENTKSEFKEALKVRFQEFLDKLKTTSLFSLPSRLRNIVPSGTGDSKIVVNGGQTYGQNEIDFSGWTQGLAALNAVVYVACYALAIRIIILKR